VKCNLTLLFAYAVLFAVQSLGILQVLGSVLLEGGPSSSASSAVMNVACTAISCLNNVAREDLALLQVCTKTDCSRERTSQQFSLIPTAVYAAEYPRIGYVLRELSPYYDLSPHAKCRNRWVGACHDCVYHSKQSSCVRPCSTRIPIALHTVCLPAWNLLTPVISRSGGRGLDTVG
jgi:hypothetical protein